MNSGINTNLMGLNARRSAKEIDNKINNASMRLSSGLRINNAADDAAGLAISERMKAQIRGLRQAGQNMEDAINLIKTADGAMGQINELVIRQEELIIQALNGTYTFEDRQKMQVEIDQLTRQIDNIAYNTHFNNIPLLNYDIKEIEPLYRYESKYVESVTPTEELVEWGTLDFIEQPRQDFCIIKADPLLEAKPATVTMALDNSIDFNDVTTLNGKSVTIGGQRFNFALSSSPDTPRFPSGTTISFNTSESVKDVLSKLSVYSSNIASVTVDETARTVTLTAPLGNLKYTLTTRDGTFDFVGNGINGEYYHNISVNSEQQENLKQVDGSQAANNVFTLDNKASTTAFTTKINPAYIYTQADIDNLVQNSIYVTGKTSITFKEDGTGTIQVSAGMTGAEMQTALTNAFSARGVTAEWSGNQLTLTDNSPSASWNTIYTYETTASSSYDYEYVTSNSLPISSVRTQVGDNERGEAYKITLPNTIDLPATYRVNGQYYTFYDSTKNPAGYSLYTYTAPGSLINVSSLSAEQIKTRITDQITSALGSDPKISRDGNTITVSYPVGSANNNLTVAGYSGSQLSYRKSTGGGSSSVLFNTTTYFNRDVSVPLQLPMSGANVDIDKLSGSGFTLQGYAFEFYNGTKKTSAYGIDISGCVTVDDVVAKMNAAIPGVIQVNSGIINDSVNIEGTNSGVVTISMSRDMRYSIYDSYTSSSYTNVFNDGIWNYDGLFTNDDDPVGTKTSVNFSNGTIAEKPYTTIDFSSITVDNLDTLLGKGFRIACASCDNEFINIVFRKNNDEEPAPEYFDMPDGARIYNYVVELDKVSDGSQIVKSILDQLQPKLDHFTWVRQGDPNTVLIIEDKRYGDLPTKNGVEQRGGVISGVYSNFSYKLELQTTKIEVKQIPDPPDTKLYIQCGANNGQGIYIDRYDCTAKALGLEGIVVDPYEEAEKSLERLRSVSDIVNGYRATCGAQQNRLGHTESNVSVAFVNISAANSRIADANIAKEMMEFTKSQILSQASFAMLAQSKQIPEHVLSLLR